MRRREFLKLSLLSGAALSGAGCAAQRFAPGDTATKEKSRPNVIIIYTDDQNFEHIGCYGGNVLTPYQDLLAKEGIKFTRGYVNTSICTPSRYSCLTGHFASRCEYPDFLDKFPEGTQTEVGFNTQLALSTPNLARMLQSDGYKTAMVGKWHIGAWYFSDKLRHKDESYTRDPWIEAEHQFDPKEPDVIKELQKVQRKWSEDIKRFGFDYAERIYFSNTQSFRNRAMNVHNLEWTVEGALDFIEQNRREPFFLYFAPTLHHDPHPQNTLLGADPRMSPAGYLDKAPDVMPSREDIYKKVKDGGYDVRTAFLTYLDEGIGAILNKLKESGVYDDTLIIFCSDHQLTSKTSLYDNGVRTPMIISWPKVIEPGQVCDELVQNTDFLPTILSACGIRVPQEAVIDGKDLMPMLKKQRQSIHNDLFFELGWTRAVCTKKYKYLALRYPQYILDKIEAGEHFYHFTPLEFYQISIMLRHPDYFDADQLYDLEKDPDETNNLAKNNEYKDILDRMKNRLDSYLKSFPSHPFGEFNSNHQS
jgi:arylsulfatase A-like enzyme